MPTNTKNHQLSWTQTVFEWFKQVNPSRAVIYFLLASAIAKSFAETQANSEDSKSPVMLSNTSHIDFINNVNSMIEAYPQNIEEHVQRIADSVPSEVREAILNVDTDDEQELIEKNEEFKCE